MKLKYYLRGLGIGIICTAIIMGIALSGNKKETMTDTEIIERARLLGMVMPENTDEPDGQKKEESPDGKETETDGKNDSNSANKAGGSTKAWDQVNDARPDGEAKDSETDADKKPDGSGAGKEQGGHEAGDAAGDTQQAGGTQQDPAQEMVQIEIKKGDYSDTVSEKLFQAGLVSDAEAFNRYLTQKGVDQSLRTGVYQIPAGATQDQIIEILQK